MHQLQPRRVRSLDAEQPNLGRTVVIRGPVSFRWIVTRKAVECNLHRMKQPTLFRRFYERSLKRTGNAVHARLSTQRKVLSVARAMWRDNTDYNDSKG